MACDMCKGIGVISVTQMQWIEEGSIARKWRIRAGVTMIELAERLKISPVAIAEMERGISNPSRLKGLKFP
jgi:predicted transcriptional regulator